MGRAGEPHRAGHENFSHETVDCKVKTLYSLIHSGFDRTRFPPIDLFTRIERERSSHPHQQPTRSGPGARARRPEFCPAQAAVPGCAFVCAWPSGSVATGWRGRIGAHLPSSLRRGPDTARFRASLFFNRAASRPHPLRSDRAAAHRSLKNCRGALLNTGIGTATPLCGPRDLARRSAPFRVCLHHTASKQPRGRHGGMCRGTTVQRCRRGARRPCVAHRVRAQP